MCTENEEEPTRMKIDKITLRHKERDTSNLTNYSKPISNTSRHYKLLEKYIQEKLTMFLEKNEFYYKYQHEFTKMKSTTTVVVETIHEVNPNIDKGRKTGMC